MFRRDRKGRRGGGVFYMLKNLFRLMKQNKQMKQIAMKLIGAK